ncbi:IkappaB kinase complex, IKAP component [Pseudovirgaria hyperparasitica]|uniref:Elongator complex protein 1 n=1 Tax=Pseudovirgaria hyperparasitica TaxID=470096 RepID=A0A6A6WA76_9PEZI|nr:IkappaB kinase complex, IKAP component [Pseudovirgaria hyperparasitica]KAF2759758.1 IkappaB kinase complex, IKAP component [Pseudovirgaria hyperparasitica]
MRNLRISRHSAPIFPDQLLPLTATAWDTTTDGVICAFGPSPLEAVIELKRYTAEGKQGAHTISTIATWDAPCPNPDLDCDRILSLHFLTDTSSVCLVLAGGDIVLVREQPLPGEDAIEIVGSVDAGISAAAWSPDEELLALSTNAGTLIYMTKDFDAVVNITLTPDDVKVSNHVSVGWGKSETQFKGKRAKALRDPTMPEHVDEGVLSALDDRSTSISWRGDGAYVVLNTVEDEKRRMLRVYSRDGVLDSVSEPVDGLESALSWRPSGNLIAGIQRRNEQIDVVFFERNGLRHGEFSLRLKPEEQKELGSSIELQWNVDSTILAVSLADRVQFWTMGNYHYYLKQEIRTVADARSGSPMGVKWHTEKPHKVTIYNAERLQDIEFELMSHIGSTSPPHDHGLVAVIDGANLKLTPLRLANVPPPVSLHEVAVDGSIKDVALAPSGRKVAVLTHDEVYTYDYLDSKRPRMPRLLSRRKIKLQSAIPRQIVLNDNDWLFVIADDLYSNASLCWRGEGSGDIELAGTFPLDGNISGMSLSSDLQHLCLTEPDGKVSQYETLTGEMERQPSENIPASVSSVRVTHTLGEVENVGHIARSESADSVSFGLTNGGNLYANERLIARNATSFLVTSAHLIFTTTQHLLKFVHLSSRGKSPSGVQRSKELTVLDMEVPADEPELDERCRRIERGARLVTAMPTAYSIVLQMPRGNLETVFPRAMVLDGIRRNIDKIDYKEAFLACRAQRVDMNILYDHAPDQFLQNVGAFIKQLNNAGYLDLFVSQLREEDVTVSMYRNTSKDTSSDPSKTYAAVNGTSLPGTKGGSAISGKINRICDAILQELSETPDLNMQNIITAHVCKSPPDLEAGLTVVGDIRKNDSERAEAAAEHICFLADVNHLYDHALGLYDLELTLLIAQQSQKDPREYLPYMQSLQELTPLRRSFEIDDKLGRRAKALGHLYSIPAFDEFKSYAQKHELYPQALELVKYTPDQLNEIMRLYADHLHANDRFRDAGLAYDFLQDHAAASQSYALAHLWREALTTAQLVPYTPDALHALASSLSDSLIETKDFAAAATIHADYLSDIPAAARLFCRGTLFAHALRLLTLHAQPSLIPSIIDTALIDASASITELLADIRTQLALQIPRIRELRAKKTSDPLAFYTGDPTSNDASAHDIPDNVSLAPTSTSTSAGTFLTRYTARSNASGSTLNTQTTRKTSKNRRREERKRARGKKGSVYEEEYLVGSVGRLVERVNRTSEEAGRVVVGLVRRGMRERAAAVERMMGEVVDACVGCVPEVWGVEGGGEPEKEDGKRGIGEEEVDGERPQGADGVLWDSMQESRVRREPPVVKAFEKLGLIG